MPFRTIDPAALQKRYGALWFAEAERFEHDEGDWDTALCAELPDVLSHHAIAAQEDEEFWEDFDHWDLHVIVHDLRLPLEQSCSEGVLLPTSQRAIRLASCPESLLKPLRWFFESCPRHVRAHLALYNYMLVRIDRARRTGCPHWHPTTALPAPEPESAFFRPQRWSARSYAR